jgi:DNA-binding beta-propeller fold protein YncE
MRILCIILLVCLIGVASVSALSVNPAVVPALTNISSTPRPVISMMPVKTISGLPQTTAVPVDVPLTIISVPAGATIIFNGRPSEYITPLTFNSSPGSRTIGLSLNGYNNYTTTVNLVAGSPKVINAQLQRAITAGMIRENLSAVKIAEPQPGALHIIPAAASPAQDNTVSCIISGQECLTLAEAGDVFAPGWYYTEGSVCGYNGSVPKYCIGGSPKMTVQPGAVQAAVLIKPENTLTKVNASHDIAGNLPVSPLATPRILGAQQQVGIIDSIFGFFNGLFGQKVSCPSGTVNCGGGCVNTNTDSLNCGACAYTCFDPAVCSGGECVDATLGVSAHQAVSSQAVSAHGKFILCNNYSYITQWNAEGYNNDWSFDPQGIAVDSSGYVYVTDAEYYSNDRVLKFDSTGGYITTWGTTGYANNDFNLPHGIAVDSSGYVYVVNTGNNRVQKFDSTGGYITSWGSLGSSRFGSNSGSGNGQFDNPQGIAVDSSGYVYVVDMDNNRVQRFNSMGVFITHWGTNGTGNGQFNNPRGIAGDSSGNVYVVDRDNSRVQKFDSWGVYITQWGTQGSGNGQFDTPQGIAVDSSGYVYVVESGNSRVQKFNATGGYITQWGNFGSGNGQFNTPLGIAVDSSGKVYLTDEGNHRVQKFSCE